jgi:hypothetical protein
VRLGLRPERPDTPRATGSAQHKQHKETNMPTTNCAYYGGCAHTAIGDGAEPYPDGSSAADFCAAHGAAFLRRVRAAADEATSLVGAGLTHEEAAEELVRRGMVQP